MLTRKEMVMLSYIVVGVVCLFLGWLIPAPAWFTRNTKRFLQE